MEECMKRSPGVLWIKAAVIYFMLGIGLGIYMGASGDHLLVPVHAHFNLLGWASLALVGLIYHQFPVAGSHRLATIQFWLHNLGLLTAMALLVAILRGNSSLEPVIGIASIVIGASVVLFAINVFQNVRA
jgi:hypothetical protein